MSGKVFIQRDYSGGTRCQFQSKFPPELENRVRWGRARSEPSGTPVPAARLASPCLVLPRPLALAARPVRGGNGVFEPARRRGGGKGWTPCTPAGPLGVRAGGRGPAGARLAFRSDLTEWRGRRPVPRLPGVRGRSLAQTSASLPRAVLSGVGGRWVSSPVSLSGEQFSLQCTPKVLY